MKLCCVFGCFLLLLLTACSDDIPGLGDSVATVPTGTLPPPVQLQWSPNGDWVLFLEGGRILMQNVDDSYDREILSGQGGYNHPVWSPDGKHVVYDHAPTLSAPDLWVVEPFSGRTPIHLTDHVRSDEFPTWSPDSEQIAFQTYRAGNRDIWIVDVNGYRDPVPFTTATAHDESPDWSPLGDQIAFVSDRNGSKNIWIQPVDGNDDDAWQLTENSEGDSTPIWSPDGTQIAYFSKRSSKWYLWVADAVPGGTSRPVSVMDSILYPNWSPDSQFLLFEADGSGWMVRADGQGQQIEIVKGLEPIWSPDGTRIAYVYLDDTRYRIGIQEQSTDLDW